MEKLRFLGTRLQSGFKASNTVKVGFLKRLH